MMRSKGRIIAGLILIILGLLIIFMKFYTFHHPSSFLLLIGGLFLASYFYNKAYGLLIPGCLLLGIALSSGHSGFHTFHDSSTWGLGLGFFAIYLIDYFYQGKTHWWPLIPGTILFITGIRGASSWFSRFWPVLIILLGIYIIVKSLKPHEKEHPFIKQDELITDDKENEN
ncbi:hypothetical protein ACFLYK_02760 [Candidatus Cloacimonadota bacterium]